MPNDRGAQILARFPGPVTVRPVLTASGLAFNVLCALIVAACLWGLWHGPETESATRAFGLGAALFGCAGAASVYMQRTNRMTLDREGFEVAIPFRTLRYRWHDVSAFESQYLFRGNHVVAFDDAAKGDGILASVNRATGFRNGSLLEDYGLGEKQLAELLNGWRDRALAGDHGPSGRDVR